MNRRGYENGSRPPVIHVMAVGQVEQTCRVHDALLAEKRVWLSIATDSRELWMRSKVECIHVFVLCATLTGSELHEASSLIRQNWPTAKILVLREGEDFLDDPLYDERIEPDASTTILVESIERLLG